MAKPTHQAATRRAIDEFFGKLVPAKLTYTELRKAMDEAAKFDPDRKIDTMTAMVFLEIRPEAFAALKAIDPPKQPFKVEGSFGREGKPAARASISELRNWFDELVAAGELDPDKGLPWDPPLRVVHGEVGFMTYHVGRDTIIKNAIVSHGRIVDVYFSDPNAVVMQMTLAEALDYRWEHEDDRAAWASAYAVWCEEEVVRLDTLAASLNSIVDRIALNNNTDQV